MDSFYERLKASCALRGTGVTKLIVDLNMSQGNLSSWKNGNVPKADTLDRIANYLNVTTDYLIGKADEPVPSVRINPDDDLEYIGQKARELPPEQRKAYMEMMKKFADEIFKFTQKNG